MATWTIRTQDPPTTTLRAVARSLASWSELSADVDIDAAAARVRPELRRNTWPRDNPDAPEIPSEIEEFTKFLTNLEGAHDVFEPGCPPASPWEQALLVERRTGAEGLALVERDEIIQRLGTDLEAVRARLREVHADLDDVQARRREADRARRRAVERWERLERQRPMRVLRAAQRFIRLVLRRR